MGEGVGVVEGVGLTDGLGDGVGLKLGVGLGLGVKLGLGLKLADGVGVGVGTGTEWPLPAFPHDFSTKKWNVPPSMLTQAGIEFDKNAVPLEVAQTLPLCHDPLILSRPILQDCVATVWPF